MMANRWVWFGAGVLVGLFAARYFLENPTGRQISKGLLKGALSFQDWLGSQWEKLREDVEDLVAEVRSELRTAEDDAAAAGLADVGAET